MKKIMPNLTVEFSENISKIISDLGKKEGISKVAILRRSVALYHYAFNEVKKGDKKLAITQNGETVKEILLF